MFRKVAANTVMTPNAPERKKYIKIEIKETSSKKS